MSTPLAPAGHEISGSCAPSMAGCPALEVSHYGKVCHTQDGAALPGSEHARTGTSAGFPVSLIPFARADMLGAGLGDIAAPDLGGTDRATILRTVFAAGEAYPMGYQLRLRPEAGEQTASRCFVLGRYVTGPSDVSPLELFEPLRSPLRAHTVDDVRNAIEAVPRERVAVPCLDDRGAAFLRDAAAYVLSGIPVVVRGDVGEEEFVSWYQVLWSELPEAIRPLLSAGWRIGWSLAQSMTMSAPVDGGAPRSAAVYDAASMLWHAPLETMSGVAFREEEHLRAGRVARKWLAADGARDLLDEIGFECPTGLQPVPVMTDPTVQQALCRLGGRLEDRDAVQRVAAHLASPEASLPRLPAAHDHRFKLLEATVAWINSHGVSPQSDAVLDQLGELEWTEVDASPGTIRLWLLRSLTSRETDVATLLRAYEAASHAGVSNGLDGARTNRLRWAFGRSLRHDWVTCGDFHLRMLSDAAAVPEVYGAWLAEWPVDVALHVVRGAGLESSRAARGTLHQLSSSPPLERFLVSLGSGEVAQGDDALLGEMGSDRRQLWACALDQLWSCTPPLDLTARGRLVRWARLLGAGGEEPLLLLAAGSRWHDGVEHVAVAEAVEDQTMPVDLWDDVAAYALRHWPALGDRITSRQAAWENILRRCPATLVALLLPGCELGEAVPQPAIAAAADQLHLTGRQTDALVTRWQACADPEQLTTRAPALWLLASQARMAPGAQAPICQLVLDFTAGSLSLARPPEAALRSFRRLLPGLPRTEATADLSLRLWCSARLPWQVRLVLEAFPTIDLEPAGEQLVALLRHQQWLRLHVARPDVHPWRAMRLALALAAFGSLDPQSVVPAWDESYLETPLWAAWTLPPKRQGDLADALEAWGVSDADQAELATRFVESANPKHRAAASARVWCSFVAPLLHRHAGPDAASEILDHFAGRSGRRFDRAALWLRQVLAWRPHRKVRSRGAVVVVPPAVAPVAALAGGHGLVPWLHGLVTALVDTAGVQRLRAAHRRSS